MVRTTKLRTLYTRSRQMRKDVQPIDLLSVGNLLTPNKSVQIAPGAFWTPHQRRETSGNGGAGEMTTSSKDFVVEIQRMVRAKHSKDHPIIGMIEEGKLDRAQ